MRRRAMDVRVARIRAVCPSCVFISRATHRRAGARRRRRSATRAMWTLECATAAGARDAATLETLNAHVGRQVWTHVDANDAETTRRATTTTTTTTTTGEGNAARRRWTKEEIEEGTRGARRDARGVREDAERA